jgi:hypothetical protein
MKFKMTIAIAALMVFGLSIIAVAYTKTAGAASMSASRCKGDSCPMKNKNASADEKASCCDDCDCCSGGSCPMKKKDETSAAVVKVSSGTSCAMMVKKAPKTETVSFEHANVVVASDDENCGCSCCGKDKDKEKKVTAGI